MYIGIDLGTTACKCVLYDEHGTELSVFNEEYALILRDSFIEQDAEEWWRIVKKGIRFVTEEASCKNVRAIAISTQGISHVPVDENGIPLQNAVSWLDERAGEELDALRAHFGAEQIFRKTGKKQLPCYTLPQLMWFKKHNPAIYQKAYKILMPLDFLQMRLTGRAMTDYSMASGTMLFNLEEKKWDSALAAFADIDTNKLPEVAAMGTPVGTVREDVCREIGLSGSVMVYNGGQDQKLAALGAGISNDTATVSFGTASAVTVLNPDHITDSEMRFPSFVYNEKDWVFENSIATTGASLKWLRGILGKSYAEMDALAAESAPGAGGVKFPSPMSIETAISGLTLATTSGDLVRALYEDIAQRIHTMLCEMHAPKNICVFGGGAKSDIWCRILAETTGCRVHRLDTPETASRGAAILASCGTLPPATVQQIF